MTKLERARQLIADAYAHAGRQEANTEQARALLASALAAEPDSTVLLTALGSVLSDQGRHAEAAAMLKRAVALGSQDRNTFFNLGVALQNVHTSEDPMPFFEEAAKHRASPETWEAYFDPQGT